MSKRKTNPYYSNKSIKKRIDKTLHQNVMLFQNLGIDSTREEKQAAKQKEHDALMQIRDLDSEFIDMLIRDA